MGPEYPFMGSGIPVYGVRNTRFCGKSRVRNARFVVNLGSEMPDFGVKYTDLGSNMPDFGVKYARFRVVLGSEMPDLGWF